MTNTYLLPEGMQIVVNGAVVTLTRSVLATSEQDLQEPSEAIALNGVMAPVMKSPDTFTSPEHAAMWGEDFYLWLQCKALALPYDYYRSLDVKCRQDPLSLTPAERAEALRIPGWRLQAACRYHGKTPPTW